MQEKILVICPSRGRPLQCVQMIDSFLSTQKMSTLKILLDMDDPCIDQYRDLIGKKCSYSIGFRNSITMLINESWQFSADCFKWFSVTNDDFIYKTDGWDLKLIGTLKLHGGIGIVYGNDLLQGANMPTTSIVSREIADALGWLQMPRLTHLCGDNAWKIIGTRAGCLFYRDDVIIEHCHYMARKAKEDDTYKHTNAGAMYDRDLLALHNWITNEGDADCTKIKYLVENYRLTRHLNSSEK